MGTPEFALASLGALWESRYPILAIFTQPDKPAGRGRHLSTPPCAMFAKEKGIPLFQPDDLKEKELASTLRKRMPDFIIVVAYGRFLPQQILEIPKRDALNVHASLLPQYRGAAPINWALINGEERTGISIMRMVKKMDAGPIYADSPCDIEPTDTAETLSKKLAAMGARLLIETLPRILAQEIVPKEQQESNATYAPLLRKEDGKINWNQAASGIHNLIRGLLPWPAAHTLIDNKILKIYDSFVPSEKSGLPPGTIYLISPRGIHVSCGQSSLCLTEVQLEGRRKLPAADFARGFRLENGNSFR